MGRGDSRLVFLSLFARIHILCNLCLLNKRKLIARKEREIVYEVWPKITREGAGKSQPKMKICPRNLS